MPTDRSFASVRRRGASGQLTRRRTGRRVGRSSNVGHVVRRRTVVRQSPSAPQTVPRRLLRAGREPHSLASLSPDTTPDAVRSSRSLRSLEKCSVRDLNRSETVTHSVRAASRRVQTTRRASARRDTPRRMLGTGFEPVSSARKAEMIGRTTPTERHFAQRCAHVASLRGTTELRIKLRPSR